MFKDSVCAGIVIYEPELELLSSNIAAVYPQVGLLLIYDNASSDTEGIERVISNFPDIVYLRSESNMGLAHGLNELLRYASEHNYDFLLTLDQDSICSSNMIELYGRYAVDKAYALFCPFVLNNGKYTFDEYKALDLPECDVILRSTECITSGCMGRVNVLNALGGFPEEYFIDYIDFDLNCRVLLAGHKILRVNGAYLYQSMGTPRVIPLFKFIYRMTGSNLFRRIQASSVYSDLRLYYAARNSLTVYRRYPNAGFRSSPFYMCMLFLYYSITYPLKRSRTAMWKSVIRGFKDSKKLNKGNLGV